MNIKTEKQSVFPDPSIVFIPCEYCGLKAGNHKKSCPNYKQKKQCEYCGSISTHRKDCPNRRITICSECKGRCGHHKKSCSKYKSRIKICEECGNSVTKHKIYCSKYKAYKEKLDLVQSVAEKICTIRKIVLIIIIHVAKNVDPHMDLINLGVLNLIKIKKGIKYVL